MNEIGYEERLIEIARSEGLKDRFVDPLHLGRFFSYLDDPETIRIELIVYNRRIQGVDRTTRLRSK